MIHKYSNDLKIEEDPIWPIEINKLRQEYSEEEIEILAAQQRDFCSKVRKISLIEIAPIFKKRLDNGEDPNKVVQDFDIVREANFEKICQILKSKFITTQNALRVYSEN